MTGAGGGGSAARSGGGSELGARIGQKLQRSGTAALSMLRLPGEARRSRGESLEMPPVAAAASAAPTKMPDGRSCTGHIVLPASATEVPHQHFANNHSVTGVTIPPSVRTIAYGAFQGCRYLTEVTIPPTVKEVGEQAFWACDRLERVVISEGVERIGERAFKECPALKSVVIPASVASVGKTAFSECRSLTTAIVLNGKRPLSLGSIEQGDRVRALPGIESQGVSSSVVGKEGTVLVKKDNLKVKFDGESRDWYTISDWVEKVNTDPFPGAFPPSVKVTCTTFAGLPDALRALVPDAAKAVQP